MKLCEFNKLVFAEAEKMGPFTPTEIPRFAAMGGGYFLSGVYKTAMAEVARIHQIPVGPSQPSWDDTQYIQLPRCYILEDGAVPLWIGHGAYMHFRPTE